MAAGASTRAGADVAVTVADAGETISLKNSPARRVIEANLADLSRRLYSVAWVPPTYLLLTVECCYSTENKENCF